MYTYTYIYINIYVFINVCIYIYIYSRRWWWAQSYLCVTSIIACYRPQLCLLYVVMGSPLSVISPPYTLKQNETITRKVLTVTIMAIRKKKKKRSYWYHTRIMSLNPENLDHQIESKKEKKKGILLISWWAKVGFLRCMLGWWSYNIMYWFLAE